MSQIVILDRMPIGLIHEKMIEEVEEMYTKTMITEVKKIISEQFQPDATLTIFQQTHYVQEDQIIEDVEEEVAIGILKPEVYLQLGNQVQQQPTQQLPQISPTQIETDIEVLAAIATAVSV